MASTGTAPSTSKNDPRDESLAVSFRLPRSWAMQSDAYSSLSMLFSGLAMISRNPIFVWPAMFTGISSYINQQPLRVKDGGMGLMAVISAFAALITVNIPRMVIIPAVPPTTQS
ncbi:hypothetical protein FRB99_001628 [Tulasnella sp. 403]|nr:hypothetical protein FRB99_001628 [Tulasnella sp. 403]